MRKLAVLGAALGLAWAAPAFSQEVAGELEGRVTGRDRAPLAGVRITVTSPNLLGRRTATTDARGRFFLPALPVGAYQVDARLVGFRPLSVENVPVRLGETTSLPGIELEPAVVQLSPVLISAERAGLDPNNTAQRIVLDAPRLDALPLERNFRETMLLAPSAVPSFLGRDGGGAGVNRDGVNVAGATGYENTYFVDGINITSPIRGETSIDLPYNFIQEMEVRTGGSSASDAQALGGVVNVVTPSGGDRLRGQFFGFFSSDGLETRRRPVSGNYQTGFTFYDAGVSLSGPLVRDRLGFFTAYNQNYEGRDYTYAFGEVRSARRQHLFAGKLTWQATPRTFGFFTVLGDPSSSEPLAMPLFGTGVPQNQETLQRKDKAAGIGVSLRGQHMLSSGVLIEGSLSQMTRLERGEPATAAGWAPIVIDHVNGTLSGGHGFAYRWDSRRRTARVDVTWQQLNHELKGGLQFEELYGDIDTDIARNSAGGTIERVGVDLYQWHSNRSENGAGTNRNPSVYLQDTWQVTPRLSLRTGLRWSRQDLYADRNTATYRDYRVRDGIQPRLGIVFQPGSPGTQRIFASFSRAAEQLPVWGFQDFGVGAETLQVFTGDPRQAPDAGEIIYTFQNGVGTPEDQNLRGQTVDAWGLGYSRRSRSFAITFAAMRRSLGRVVASGTDTLGGSVWGNPGEGAMAHFPRIRRTYDALETTVDGGHVERGWFRVSYVLSRTHGNYPGLFASDWKLGVPNWGPMFILPEQYLNGTGLLPNDRPHVFKAFGAYPLLGKLSVGGSLLVASGVPLTEYGGISIGAPFRGFASKRGIAGRTPTVWDASVRTSWDLPGAAGNGMRTRVLLDIQHLLSPRKAVELEQWRYTCLDDNGQQSCPNASYGSVLQYQPPMMARLGLVMDFGDRR